MSLVAPGSGRARIVVTDRGPGIEAQHHGRMFERFARFAPARHFGGFGLGLWIARVIVEAHGGTIGVESQVGQGASFFVNLPLTTSAPPRASHLAGQARVRAPRRCLLDSSPASAWARTPCVLAGLLALFDLLGDSAFATFGSTGSLASAFACASASRQLRPRDRLGIQRRRQQDLDAAVAGAAGRGLVAGDRVVLAVAGGDQVLGRHAGLLLEETHDVHRARHRQLPVGGELRRQLLRDRVAVGVTRHLDLLVVDRPPARRRRVASTPSPRFEITASPESNRILSTRSTRSFRRSGTGGCRPWRSRPSSCLRACRRCP